MNQFKRLKDKETNMAKKVLLARPHPFVEREMRPFIENEGFLLEKLENTAAFAGQARTCHGAIISLALSSSIPESAEEISVMLRNGNPGVSLVFAALMDLQTATFRLQKVASALGIQTTVLGVDAGNLNHRALGKPATFLYISKEDLMADESRKIAAKLLKKHI
jgi:hypothetical protein